MIIYFFKFSQLLQIMEALKCHWQCPWCDNKQSISSKYGCTREGHSATSQAFSFSTVIKFSFHSLSFEMVHRQRKYVQKHLHINYIDINAIVLSENFRMTENNFFSDGPILSITWAFMKIEPQQLQELQNHVIIKLDRFYENLLFPTGKQGI